MGQSEIVEFLKTCEEPVTRREIANGLEWDATRVSRILNRLLFHKEVDFIEHPREIASEKVGYILLRRTRFFFLVKE